jgi:lipoyl(octanoyl) transferase
LIARLLDLGRRPYREVWSLQHEIHERVAAGEAPATWLVVEHDPVITLGRNGRRTNVLDPRGIEVVEVERGGDVTFHGPGQLVVYPIMKLPRFREIVPLVRALEETVIETLAHFGIKAHGRPEHRGVYVGDNAICAIGLAVRRMTSLHGIALNADIPLDYDRLIRPCGMPQFGITSISREIGRDVTWSQARDAFLPVAARRFGLVFQRDATPAPAGASNY